MTLHMSRLNNLTSATVPSLGRVGRCLEDPQLLTPCSTCAPHRSRSMPGTRLFKTRMAQTTGLGIPCTTPCSKPRLSIHHQQKLWRTEASRTTNLCMGLMAPFIRRIRHCKCANSVFPPPSFILWQPNIIQRLLAANPR